MTYWLNFEESYHFWILSTFFDFQNIWIAINIEWIECLLPWHTSNNLSEQEVKGLNGDIQISYRRKILSPADFTGICILPTWLYREKWLRWESWQYFFAIGVSGWWWWKAPMLVIWRKIYYFAKKMCSLFIYSPIVQTKKTLAFCLCATMIILCQIKNEHSWSKPIVVRCFGLHPQQNQNRTTYILCDTNLK